MKKSILVTLVAWLFLIIGLQAQSVQQGMNDLYAQRHKSAATVFQKLIAANPKNIEAIYWLGQTYFATDDNEAAQKLYKKALADNAGAPLLLVGLGHAALLENKAAAAKQNFDAALAACRSMKTEEPAVQTAIGRAITASKTGDFMYAIEILKAASEKDPKNTETLLQLGNAYLKARPADGSGEAFATYKKALEVNPSFAEADLRIAKLFESQKNWELVLEYLNEAVTRDNKFAPAYYELFYYNFYRAKYAEAETQLNKFIFTADTDPKNDYLYAQLCWAKKDWDCAITKGERVITAMGEMTMPRVLKLLADANFKKGDFSNARKYIDLYLKKEKTENTISFDYKLLADILAKTGGTGDEVYNAYLKGAAQDSVLSSKIDFLRQAADAFKTGGDRIREADIRSEIIRQKGANAMQRDYFDAGLAYFQGGNLDKSDAMYDVYTNKWPNETFGWQMKFQIARSRDTTMEKGLAVPFATRYIEVMEKDTAKNKKSIISTSGYLAQYFANIAKDKIKAIYYLKKILLYDPNNEDVKNYIKKLE
jgi:tetratricopeptide (TPR) repeat protein